MSDTPPPEPPASSKALENLTPEETAALHENVVEALAAAKATSAAEGSLGSATFVLGDGARGMRKKLPNMERRFNVFTEKLRSHFCKVLRRPVQISMCATQTCGAAQIGEIVPSWAAVADMRWTQLGQAGFLGMNHALSFALIELAYGAPVGQLQRFELKTPRQRLTEVERQTLAPLLHDLAAALAATMPEHIVGSVSGVSLPFPIQIDPEKAVEGGILKTFDFTIGNCQAQIVVLLFSHVLEHLDDEHPSSLEQTVQMLTAHVGQTDVELTAILGKTNVPLHYVASLQRGDVLWLDGAQTDPLPVYVEQTMKFLAQPIARSGVLGVEIVTRIP